MSLMFGLAEDNWILQSAVIFHLWHYAVLTNIHENQCQTDRQLENDILIYFSDILL